MEKWISVKKRLPKIGTKCFIYGVLHAFRENYPKGTIEKRMDYPCEYYGLKSINGEPKMRWFGGWCIDEHNECITHWMPFPEPPKTH